ncbi:MAG: serine protease [Polyangiaceae bacterium]|nr:serine protease [Polyangiaceae bacterium]
MRNAPLSLALAVLSIAVMRLATGCAATGSGQDDLLDDGVRDNPIVNGQETADYPATGVLLIQGQPFCTGTIVGTRSVLTAAHCIDQMDPSQVSFGIGAAADQLEAELKVVSGVQHPNWDSQSLTNDVAVLTLGEDSPIPAIPLNPAMDDSWIGRKVTLVGYGVTDGTQQTGAGVKRMVDVTIDKLEPTTLHYTTQNGQTACNGDSGGPAFADENGQLYVAGITSYGDQGCEQYGVYTRVDAFIDFIEEQIKNGGSAPADPNDPGVDPNDPNNPDPNDPGVDPNDPAPDPSDPGAGVDSCMGETLEGKCDGDTLIYCDQGEVFVVPCDYYGLSCAYDDQAQWYDCL